MRWWHTVGSNPAPPKVPVNFVTFALLLPTNASQSVSIFSWPLRRVEVRDPTHCPHLAQVIDHPRIIHSKCQAMRKPTPPERVLLTQSRSDEQPVTRHDIASGDETQDILRIIPTNIEARKAFDTIVRLDKEGRLHQHHARYVRVTGRAPVDHISQRHREIVAKQQTKRRAITTLLWSTKVISDCASASLRSVPGYGYKSPRPTYQSDPDSVDLGHRKGLWPEKWANAQCRYPSG